VSGTRSPWITGTGVDPSRRGPATAWSRTSRRPSSDAGAGDGDASVGTFDKRREGVGTTCPLLPAGRSPYTTSARMAVLPTTVLIRLGSTTRPDG
jgi:hypothetical protein